MVYDEIKQERARQDAKWGGPAHDDEHDIDDFGDFIAQKLAHMSAGSPAWKRAKLVQIAALAVAAIESADRKAS